MKTRFPIQISSSVTASARSFGWMMVCVCNDGTLWYRDHENFDVWSKLPEIPQPQEENDPLR